MSISQNEIRNETSKDCELQLISNAIKTGNWDNLKEYKIMQQEFCEVDGIILHENRIVLPKSLRQTAINIAHQGHLGVQKVKNLLHSKIYWKGMDSHITEALSKCRACQSVGPYHALIPSPLPNHPWEELAIDLCGPLPSGDKLLVIIDLYSRYPIVEVVKNATTSNIINKLENIFSLFGYPGKVRMDNGPPFSGNDFKKYLKLYNIKAKHITPYYPQANGVVERFMRVIKKTIRTASYGNKNWVKELNRMLLNYRTATHMVTGQTPSSLLFNRSINNNLPFIDQPKHPSDSEVRNRQETINRKTKQWFNQKKKATECDVAVNDYVILRREKNADKTKSKYYKTIFKVIDINHNMVTVINERGNKYTRNITYVKKVQSPETEKPAELPLTNDKLERKKYPLWNRQKIYGHN